MKIDFTPAERQVVEKAFNKYAQILDVVCQIMIADGRMPDNCSMSVAEDKSGFLVQSLTAPITAIEPAYGEPVVDLPKE